MSNRNYVQWIRSKVGHKKILLLHAGGCVFNEKGEVLLQLRGDSNMWGLPGGCLELGETPEQTAIREVKEETGLDVEVSELIGVYTDTDASCPNGDKFQSILVAYMLKVIGGSLSVDYAETLALKYFSFADMPKLFCAQHEQILDDVKRLLAKRENDN